MVAPRSLPYFLRVVVVMVLLPALTLVVVPLAIAAHTPAAHAVDTAALRPVALVAWAGGAGLVLWSSNLFVVLGRGLPTAVDPPKRLVARGPYRHVRNPMYLGGMLLVAGHVAWTPSLPLLAYALAVIVGSHLFVVHYEEPRLERRFGAGYVAYRREVPRWLPRASRMARSTAREGASGPPR
jgi:protein-S-isoprenylcysteine O-methyltransferase Ste14